MDGRDGAGDTKRFQESADRIIRFMIYDTAKMEYRSTKELDELLKDMHEKVRGLRK